jgi:hypothetical protein
MTRIVFLLTLSLLAGAAQRPAFPLKPDAAQRRLVDQRGQPFFINADTPWLIFYKTTEEEAQLYLDNRKAKGFTTVMVHLLAYQETLANRAGATPLKNLEDFSTPDPRFFRYAEQVVEMAAKRDLLVMIAPVWIGCCEGSWRGIMKANGVEKNRALGQYIGKRFKRFKNVMWIMGGDKDPGEYFDLIRAQADGIRGQAPHQLMTAHPGSPNSARDVYEGQPWLALNATYTYSPEILTVGRPQHHVYAASLRDYQRTPPMPFFLLETAYENERNSTPQMIRRQAYWSVLSGSCGHALGNKPIYEFGDGWREALDARGSQDMARMGALFRSMKWETLVPDSDHRFAVAGFGTFDGAASKDARHAVGYDYVTTAASADGTLAVAYLPVGGALTVDLTRMSGMVKAEWFDPTSGARTPAAGGPQRNEGTHEYSAPGENAGGGQDWVLVLTAVK